MTKLVWLIVLIASVAANDIQGVLPLGDDIKVESHDTPKVIEDPMKLVEPVRIENSVIVSESEPPKIQNSKDLDETVLRPIGPIFPSFLQPGGFFGRMPSLRDGGDTELSGDEQSGPHRGILTIILVKSKNSATPQVIEDVEKLGENVGNTAVQYKDQVVNSAERNFKTLTQFLMHDLFGKKFESQDSGMPHLLGGNDDPDHFIRFSNGEEDKDFIRYVKGDDMPVFGDDIGRHRNLFGEREESKNCNFLRFLRLKAHTHYRSIVHLVFISCIVLIILMMISLSIKVNKRRNALRRYAKQGIDISSIDSAVSKQREAEQMQPKLGRTFRLGSLRTSYEQRMAPPAYDQVNEPQAAGKSSLAKSLASAYKNRYQRMPSGQDEDRKSITSLPPYEDKTEPKN